MRKEEKQEKNMRAERHIIKGNKLLDELTFKSKNLYNIANYYVRQAFILANREQLNEEELKLIIFINSIIDKFNEKKEESKKMSYICKEKSYLNYNFIDFFMKNAGIIDNPYRALPAATSQQILRKLDGSWKSFFAGIKDYAKNKSKYNGRPKPPKYLDKDGRYEVIFPGSNCKVVDGYIKFPNKLDITVKTKVKQEQLKQVRIVPRNKYHVIEIVYEKKLIEPKEKYNRCIGIDSGIDNIVAVTNNVGLPFFLINGKIIKSINQYYNKKKARLMSYVGDRGSSNRIRSLTTKRNNIIDDKIHKTTRYIIDYCVENNIDTIIFGHNKGWKREVNIGKRNNQNFVSIPHSKIISQLQYKSKDYGINIVEVEEGYTSKCDALALEKIKKHEKYSGKRDKRGFFQSGTETMINADINGSLNILRKKIGDDFIKEIKNITPVRINII